ncbi:MAG TPA: FAD-dependent oxidoreductase [Terriglobia bacterium]|nr:FAD-dependent oxidoreductase [Terriglobia bacterium]
MTAVTRGDRSPDKAGPSSIFICGGELEKVMGTSMKQRRRAFVKSLAAGAAFSTGLRAAGQTSGGFAVRTGTFYDVAVVGAGVFGAWTTHHLRRGGKSVVLLDGYGPANSRASSGGESRVIRCSYGDVEFYSRWAQRSLTMWQELFARTGQHLFYQTGVLMMARADDPLSSKSLETLGKLGVRHERLSRTDLENRYPQITFGPVTWAIYEPESGAILARRAVQALVEATVKSGVDYLPEAAISPQGKGKLDHVTTRGGATIIADSFVFACGPWLPKVFPAVLEGRIYSTRQEVFFFGVAAGDRRFAPPQMPVWIDFGSEIYGLPDLENRGFKVALDRHGPPFDPDTSQRVTTAEDLAAVREYIAGRFPALKSAPVVETRVCQYENTSNGDFLIDRHPDFDNVWLIGGGSGHGFKHGPALGEYVAARVSGEEKTVDRRFSLATKDQVQKRTVY